LDAKEIYSSFKIQDEQQIFNSDFHILKPLQKPWLEALSKISMWVMIITVLLFIGISIDGQGKVISNFKVENTQSINQKFKLTSNSYLTDIILNASTNKSLKNFNIKIQKENKLLFSLNGTRAYRFKEGNKNNSKVFSKWDSRAKKVSIYLHLKELGEYQFIASAIDKTVSSSIQVTIKEREARMDYLGLFFFITFLLFGIYRVISWRYKQKLNNEKSLSTYTSQKRDKSYVQWTIFLLFIIYLIIQSD